MIEINEIEKIKKYKNNYKENILFQNKIHHWCNIPF